MDYTRPRMRLKIRGDVREGIAADIGTGTFPILFGTTPNHSTSSKSMTHSHIQFDVASAGRGLLGAA